MKQLLTSKKGASSILVVLLLVVLVVFGIAALTTSLSNMRLGQKNAEWSTAYYTAEAQAQECYAKIDKAVHDAFDSGKDITQAVVSQIETLDFGTSTEVSDDAMLISFETWNGDIGISAALALDLTDKDSLRPVKWQEKQLH
jgi:Tfp pilus assembly protein PilX